MMGEHGLAWPWESLHIEALAWFDHWLKGQDTGILEGPRFRYVLPEAEGWRTARYVARSRSEASCVCAAGGRRSWARTKAKRVQGPI